MTVEWVFNNNRNNNKNKIEQKYNRLSAIINTKNGGFLLCRHNEIVNLAHAPQNLYRCLFIKSM